MRSAFFAATSQRQKGGRTLRISVWVCAFLLVACFALPMAAQQPYPSLSGAGAANHITQWFTTT
jgi:hypothetical protein